MPVRRVETTPTLKQLNVFLAVAATGSTVAASNQLFISQSSVSYGIDQLENLLQTTLFERRRSGCYLTAQGRILQVRAKRVLDQYSEAVSEVVHPEEKSSTRCDAMLRKLRDVQVRALLAIWRAGSFRAAASQLGISEASLQEPARELEKLLRTTLYRRSTAGVEANAAGAKLARKLSAAHAEIRYAIEEIGAKRPDSFFNLRIGLLALSPRPIVTKIATELFESHPQVRIQVVEADYESQAAALRAGDIDLIFGTLRMPQPYEDLINEQLFEDPFVFACGPTHPLASSKLVTPRQLSQHEFVLPPKGFPRRDGLDRAFAQWNIGSSRYVETSCLETTMGLLRGGKCISVISRWHVRYADPSLCYLNVGKAKWAPRVVGLTLRRNWLPTAFQTRFVQLVRERTFQVCDE